MRPFEEFVEQSQRARTTGQLRAVFERAIAAEGFESFILATVSQGLLGDVAWQAFPPGHFETYMEENWARVDPVLDYALRAPRAFAWESIAPRLTFDREQARFLEAIKRNGVHHCIVMPFQCPAGRRRLIGISKRHRSPPDLARLPILHAICGQAWARYVDLRGIGAAWDCPTPRVTARELEVLKWIKQGKTNQEIADIQKVSVKTVEYHVGSILRKLGASNRVAAVVIAIQRHILEL